MKVRTGASGKIIAAIVVLAGVSALAAYGYETGQFKVPAKSVVSDRELPKLPTSSGQ